MKEKDNKKRLLKETRKEREKRIKSSRDTYTKVMTPKKGKGSYDRKALK